MEVIVPVEMPSPSHCKMILSLLDKTAVPGSGSPSAVTQRYLSTLYFDGLTLKGTECGLVK